MTTAFADTRTEPAETRVTRVADRLRDLLPGIYRAKDEQLRGSQLAAFLRALARELARLEEAIEALDDDHFVERASPEALSLLAGLYGAKLIGADAGINRGIIARSVHWRRRRGTRAMLEEMLSVATGGWSVAVHEGYRSLMVTQDVQHVVPSRGRTAILWDPIALSDPLARRMPTAQRRSALSPVGPVLAMASNETVDAALYRLGRVDAGRPAISTRTAHLCGWARPEGVLIRTAALVPVELEDVPCWEPEAPALDGRRIIALDPLNRPTSLLWREPPEPPELLGGLTDEHEPDLAPREPPRRAFSLLTPTALADDPDAVVAAGAIELRIAGVPVVGGEHPAGTGAPLPYAPLGGSPLLWLADPSRLGAGDAFLFELYAARSGSADPVPKVDVRVAYAEKVGEPIHEPAADWVLEGASVVLRITRTKGPGRARRAPSGSWAELDTGATEGTPVGAAVPLTIEGSICAVWPALPDGSNDLHLAVLGASGASPRRVVPILVDGRPLSAAGGLGVASSGSTVYLALPDSGALSIYRVTIADGQPAASAQRLDAVTAPRPPERRFPSMAVGDDGHLYLFGGENDHAPLDDLWSFSLGDGRFRKLPARNRPPRMGATLLWQSGSLVLLGGHATAGELAHQGFRCELGHTRLVWAALPDLPMEANRPGQLVARIRDNSIEAMVWADRTRPASISLAPGANAWSLAKGAGATVTSASVEDDGPNPPAQGRALFAGDDLLLLGPSPLPPSEVLFRLGGDSHLAFLPALDLMVGESVSFSVAEDGSTTRLFRDGELSVWSGPYPDTRARAPGVFRLGVPGRLSVHPYRLRQRCFGRFDAPVAFTDAEGVIGLDPRHGRVVLPPGAPPGEVTASYTVGRGAGLGAGAMPADRKPASFWEEPGAPAPTPPDLRPDGPPLTAYVHPRRAGQTQRRRNADVPIFARPEQALAAALPGAPGLVGILGSPKLDPCVLAGAAAGSLSLFAVDPAHAPLFLGDPLVPDEPSLSVCPGFGGNADTELWLAGLWVAGRLDLLLTRGQADLRFCTLGRAGAVGLRLSGGGHEWLAGRRSLHEIELEIRLYGCVVGAVELPPWARLTAAGCTFDGGQGGRAIRAAGAHVRLRHCTVRGAVEAGELYASSCAFGGAVQVARTDKGWVRHSLVQAGAWLPRLYHSLDHRVCFASVEPTDPTYLVLSSSNGPSALAAGEHGRAPGAHGERSDRLRELMTRAELNMPIGMANVHLDRVTQDLARMGRSSP
ncbi:MAG: kelch repeat-containing protein [Byssovorax sp.]